MQLSLGLFDFNKSVREITLRRVVQCRISAQQRLPSQTVIAIWRIIIFGVTILERSCISMEDTDDLALKKICEIDDTIQPD